MPFRPGIPAALDKPPQRKLRALSSSTGRQGGLRILAGRRELPIARKPGVAQRHLTALELTS